MDWNNSTNFKAIGKIPNSNTKENKKHRYGNNTEASLRTKNEEISSAPVDFWYLD